MTHPNDVPPSALLPKLAIELRTRNAVAPPPWATFAKTGVHKQRAPTQVDWWYLRSASVLRKIYLKGYVGIERLSAEYGGKRDRGSAPYHARSGSRSILREIVHQLEKAGLVQPYKTKGRRVSPEGAKLLDSLSRDILKGMAAERPELAKYPLGSIPGRRSCRMAYGEDSELDELRRRRTRQIQDMQVNESVNAQAYAAQEAEMARRDQERSEVLRRILTPEARERLARIRLAKPEVAGAVEQQLIALAASGRIQRAIDDATLRALLERIAPERREIKITRR